jgi:hypothetical protein
VEQEVDLASGELVNTLKARNRYAEAGDDLQLHKQPEWMQSQVKPPVAALSFFAEGASASTKYYDRRTASGLFLGP